MKQKYILPICLLLAACSSEEVTNNLPVTEPDDTAVSFSANISGNSSRSDDASGVNDYLHQQFIKDQSRIRIVNTVNYSVPQFDDPAEYEEYTYQGNGEDSEETTPYPNFRPTTEGEGFDWNRISPTANHFVFEAVCYPLAYKHFDKVQSDQSTIDNLWKSDLLLAYHWQDLDERYKIVELHFRHAFAMVKVEADLPISMMPQDAGGFPRNAVTSVRLVKIQRGYEVDYTSAVDNNRLRPVQATGEEESIEMYQIEGPDENNPNTQSYTYCGILPAQGIESSEDGRPKELVEFTILTYPGEPIEGTDQWKEPVEKTYYYVPQDNFSLVQEHITTLKLTYNHEVPEIIQVGASIEEWGNWYTGIVLEPETETTPAEPQP